MTKRKRVTDGGRNFYLEAELAKMADLINEHEPCEGGGLGVEGKPSPFKNSEQFLKYSD